MLTELDHDDHSSFRDCIKAGRPVLYRGLVNHWQATSCWSEAYFCEVFASEPLPLTRISAGSELGFGPGQGKVCWLPFKVALDLLRLDPVCNYLADFDMPEILRADLGPCGPLEVLDEFSDREKRIGFYHGYGGQFSPLHYDDEENLYCVLKGVKEISLISSASFAEVYPYQDRYRADHSQVNLRKPDNNRFPKFEGVNIHLVSLHAGDALYIPSGWWHEIRSRQRNTALAFVRHDESLLLSMFERVSRSDWQAPDHLLGDDLIRAARSGLTSAKREKLSQRLLESGLGDAWRYLMQNVFDLPLGGYFER